MPQLYSNCGTISKFLIWGRHSALGFDVFSQNWPILLLLKCPYFQFFWIENTAYWIKFHVLGVINYVLGLKFFRDNPRKFWGLQQASDS